MGFNKKMISTTNLIIEYKNGGTFQNLFDSDGIFLIGKKTIKFYEIFEKKGLTNKLVRKLEKWSRKKK
jgi:hypothetical protein